MDTDHKWKTRTKTFHYSVRSLSSIARLICLNAYPLTFRLKTTVQKTYYMSEHEETGHYNNFSYCVFYDAFLISIYMIIYREHYIFTIRTRFLMLFLYKSCYLCQCLTLQTSRHIFLVNNVKEHELTALNLSVRASSL